MVPYSSNSAQIQLKSKVKFKTGKLGPRLNSFVKPDFEQSFNIKSGLKLREGRGNILFGNGLNRRITSYCILGDAMTMVGNMSFVRWFSFRSLSETLPKFTSNLSSHKSTHKPSTLLNIIDVFSI